jgi:hypothetical protein
VSCCKYSNDLLAPKKWRISFFLRTLLLAFRSLDSHENDDGRSSEASSQQEEGSRYRVHGGCVNCAVHGAVHQRHQRFADTEQRIHFTCGAHTTAPLELLLVVFHFVTQLPELTSENYIYELPQQETGVWI